MITVYFNTNKKYLKQDTFIKYFNDIDNILDLIAKIKDKTQKLHIIAHYQDILDVTLNDIGFDYDYEEIKEVKELTTQSIKSDLLDLKKGKIDKLCYRPKQKWTKILGDKVYLSYNPAQTYSQTKLYTFHPSDLVVLFNNLKNKGKIPQICFIKMAFEIKNML